MAKTLPSGIAIRLNYDRHLILPAGIIDRLVADGIMIGSYGYGETRTYYTISMEELDISYMSSPAERYYPTQEEARAASKALEAEQARLEKEQARLEKEQAS